MSFEKGSVSFRIFKSANSKGSTGSVLPDDSVERFAKKALPDADAMPIEECSGWTTGRYLLDRNINSDSISVAGRTRVTLVKAERKIPGALFKAECKQEELATLQAKGTSFLKRAEKMEISKSVYDRMIPDMPLSLSGIDVVTTKDGAYASAISDSNVDLFLMAWKSTLDSSLIPYTPEVAAVMNGVNINTLYPTSFSSSVPDSNAEQNIGTEFLTWLWYFSEQTGVHNDFGFVLDGPFTFIHEGDGAHEIIIRKGNPGISSEAKSALLAGKKLLKAKLTMARGEDQWTCSVNGSDWAFNSMKLPKGEKLDPISMFDVRMSSIATFIEAFEGLYKLFLDIRKDADKWKDEVAGIIQWINDKISKD